MYKLFTFSSIRAFSLMLSFVVAISGVCSSSEKKITQTVNTKPPVPVQANSAQAKITPTTSLPSTLPLASNKGITVPSKEVSSPTQATNVPSTLIPSSNKETTMPSKGVGNPMPSTLNYPTASKPNKKEDTMTLQEGSSLTQATKEDTDFITNIITTEQPRQIVCVLTNRLQAFANISCIEYIIKDGQCILPYLQKAKENQKEVVVVNRHDAPQVHEHLDELWNWIMEYRTSDKPQNVFSTLNIPIEGYALKEIPIKEDPDSDSGSFFVLFKKEEQKKPNTV